MKIQGKVIQEKLSTNLNSRYVVDGLDEFIPNYSNLPEHEKIALDIKHLTLEDLLTEFKDGRELGGYGRFALLVNETNIFRRHVYNVYNIEDMDGHPITNADDLLKIGGGYLALGAAIVAKTVSHLYNSAVLTEDELKNS